MAIVWDAGSGGPVRALVGRGQAIRSAQYSQDGKWIVTAGDAGITVWNALTAQEQIRFDGGIGGVSYAAFSPDGSLILSAGTSVTALWEAATGKQLRAFSGASTRFFWGAFSSDGKQVVLLGDAGAAVWEVASGRQVAEIFQGGPLSYSIAFSPDGKRLVGGSRSQTAEIFDIATGVAVETLEGHEREVFFATYSTSGRLVATASADNLALVWDVSGVEQGSALDIACARLGNNTSLADVEARYGLRDLAPICGDNPPLPVDWATLQ